MNKAKKRIFRLLLAALMTFALLPAAALAAGDAFIVAGGVLGDDYTYDANGVLTFKNPGYYTVSMALPGSTTTTDIIVVEGGTAEAPINLTLNGVKISSNTSCALEVKDSPPSYLNLTLVGANTLSSGDNFPGIRCQQGATLTIDGGGVLTATGGDDGAGIGSSHGFTGGVITINGGTVTATGGRYGAGIGGGGSNNGGVITINGGTITANGGDDGAGIGGGLGFVCGSGGTIIIIGGSVKANSGGGGAQAIGRGAGGAIGSLQNNNGVDVYLTTVTLVRVGVIPAGALVSSLTASVDYAYGVDDVVTDSDGKLYLYLPSGTMTTAAQAADPLPPHTIRKYTGGITTEGDHTAAEELIVQLAAPDVLAWDVTTPGKATWNAVLPAVSYTVQLYKDGAGQGSAVTGATEYDFTSVIALAGTGNYTFTVIAAGNGVNYTDSDPSVESATYTTPAINPASRNYDLNAPADVTTAITWNGAASVTSVVYGAYTLVQDTDYALDVNDLTVKHSYLSGLSLTSGDTLDFTINFDTGATATLTVNVVNSYVPPYVPSSNANLSSLSVNGTPVSGFDPNDTGYDVELPYGSSSATVTATVAHPLASCVITDAPSLPGSATVTVTAEGLRTPGITRL